MILKYPNPTLRQKSATVTGFDTKLKQLAQELLTTVVPDPREPLGVGLAANQIGKLQRVFIMLMQTKKIEVVINPQIIKTSTKLLSSLPKDDRFLEGCLSFPGYYGFVDRPLKIKVTYQNLSGSLKRKTLQPPFSIYFQHEADHLDGILFIDYIKKSRGQLYFGPGREKLQPVKNPFL